MLAAALALRRASIRYCTPIPASIAVEKLNKNMIIDAARSDLTFGMR